MALKDPKMSKQGTAAKWKRVTLMIPQKLEITLVGKTNFFRSLLKFGVILIILTLLNPSMTTKLLYHPQMLREERLNSKAKFVIKEYSIGF
jgi:hypothetical protein